MKTSQGIKIILILIALGSVSTDFTIQYHGRDIGNKAYKAQLRGKPCLQVKYLSTVQKRKYINIFSKIKKKYLS